MRHSGVEPPGMYSSGEFNDNEVLYMTQEGPLSIQRMSSIHRGSLSSVYYINTMYDILGSSVYLRCLSHTDSIVALGTPQIHSRYTPHAL